MPALQMSETRSAVPRLSATDRKAQILAQAALFFSEHGFSAQTRALAAACGVAQRLLYRYFPSKSALISAVYEAEIAGPFKVVWLEYLEDRAVPIETRLNMFYGDYARAVLTRKWLRLFLFSSLEEAWLAPPYIQSIIKRILLTIVHEVAREAEMRLPANEAVLHEIGWVLHGAVSHHAIRRHLYDASRDVAVDHVLAMTIASFVHGFPALVRSAQGLSTISQQVVD